MSEGSFSCLIIASMMRMFAWWGMKASRSSARTPAASSALRATGAMPQTAQRNTVCPAMPIAGQRRPCSWTSTQDSRCEMAFHCAPSDPQTVGPMAGVSDGPTTAAPAPSPKMKADPRSFRSVKSDSFSTPITRTWRALPPRTMSLARVMPWQ